MICTHFDWLHAAGWAGLRASTLPWNGVQAGRHQMIDRSSSL
jgi:hypothetical protein